MLKQNPLKNWRSVAQVAKQCAVTPQAIRDAVKSGKIEAWSVGEYLLIHKSQIPIFEQTRKVKWEKLSEGHFKKEVLPSLGRRSATLNQQKS